MRRTSRIGGVVDEWWDAAGGHAARKCWAMAERRPLIRPAGTFSPDGEKGRFFGLGATTNMSHLRRWDGRRVGKYRSILRREWGAIGRCDQAHSGGVASLRDREVFS